MHEGNTWQAEWPAGGERGGQMCPWLHHHHREPNTHPSPPTTFHKHVSKIKRLVFHSRTYLTENKTTVAFETCLHCTGYTIIPGTNNSVKEGVCSAAVPVYAMIRVGVLWNYPWIILGICPLIPCLLRPWGPCKMRAGVQSKGQAVSGLNPFFNLKFSSQFYISL